MKRDDCSFLHVFIAFTLKQASSDLRKTSLKNLAVRASNPCLVECAPDGTPSWYILENGTILSWLLPTDLELEHSRNATTTTTTTIY